MRERGEGVNKMKISIFTPTNNTSYLMDLYETIKAQDYYEWVIVPNGDNAIIPEEINNDPRTKVWPYEHEYVGALKAFACSKCEGDVLLEVDHDDLLTEDAIAETIKAFEENPEIGFAFSNTANFRNDFEATERYGDAYGWEYRDFYYKGHKLDEVVSFDSHPTAASRIWYQPNHLRAWRKTVYDKIGGHNVNMRVLDDQELLCRTYLLTDFYHIDKCLYLYRITGNNTWLKYNQEIQDNVVPIHSRHIEQMATVWCARNDLLALDFGGRFHKKHGVISVDLKDADVNTNLNEEWPFADNSVGLIIANDILEHLKDPIHAMSEAHRVLADGGLFLIQVPSTDGRGAFQDPTHISFWNENSFWYYTRSEQAKYIDNTTIRFQDVVLQTLFPSDWHKQHNISYVYVHLVAVKGTRRLSGAIGI